VTIERLLEAGRALEAGELDRAERVYRQVAEADPLSSIAVVGLARVALRRGAQDEAARLARSALSIDPGNAAARRLVEAHPGALAGASPPPGSWGGSQPLPGSRGGSQPPALAGAPTADAETQAEWPWPDLDEQLARYRKPAPGLLGRLLRRGRR
jgi:tetratricopeptide (TPR) repeat protein